MQIGRFSRGWQAATATIVLAAAIVGHTGPAQAAIPADVWTAVLRGGMSF